MDLKCPFCSVIWTYGVQLNKLDGRKAMAYGCLPEVYLEQDTQLNEKLLSSYSGTYLKEEIQAEALTRNLEGYSRFILTAAVLTSFFTFGHVQVSK
jgi:hypothetical protein